MSKKLNFKEFSKMVKWDEYYPIVCDCPNYRFHYTGCEMTEELMDIFYHAGLNDSLYIEPMGNANDEVVKVMKDNCLEEFKPCDDVADDGYERLKESFDNNDGMIVIANTDDVTIYILFFGETDDKHNKQTIVVNGQKINYEIGHSVQEWNELFGNNENLWDISIDDFINGAVESNEDMIYWYINGRLYETE